MKNSTLLALLVLVGIAPTWAKAEPGDLLQTFLNPRGTTYPSGGHFWIRGAMTAVGENVLVGFPFDDTFGADAGIAYLFDASTGKVLHTFKSPKPAAGGNFGCSAAAVGNRILIGAYRESTEQVRLAGNAYVFDASTRKLLYTLVKPSPAPDDRFGFPAAVLGENFLVTCKWDNTGAKNAGAVFLYDSQTGEVLQTFRKPKPSTNDGFGNVLAAVGDNLLVADYNDDTSGPDAGAAYLFDGATAQLLQTFYNPQPGRKNGFGVAAAALGDNVLIADKSFRPSRADGGVVYLCDCATGEVLRTFQNPAPAVDDGFGQSIAVVDGNVLIGANHANANGFNVGAAHLFDGSTGKLVHTFLNPTPAWSDYFGMTMTALGKNLVITSPFDDTNGIDGGAAYLFEGGASADFQDREARPVTESNAPTTRIYVRTTPPGAKVLLDGQPIGISNGLFFAPTGDHKISLEMSSHDPHSRDVKILQGQITRIEVQLKRSS